MEEAVVESTLLQSLTTTFPPTSTFSSLYSLEKRINISPRQSRAVYLARRKDDGTAVVVKVLSKVHPRPLSSAEVSLLRREPAIQAFCTSSFPAGCVELVDFFESPSKLYLVMEHMEGGDMLTYLSSLPDGSFTEDSARVLFAAIVQSVAWLHARGICHRDIKPSNVLLSLDGKPKIGDFGLATFISSGMTTPVGTRAFAAPEVFPSASASASASANKTPIPPPRSPHDSFPPPDFRQIPLPSERVYSESIDVFSLGVMLYIMVFGIVPQTPILSFPPSPVSQHLKDLVLSLVNPDPDARPSAAEILSSPWLSNLDPPPSHPPTPTTTTTPSPMITIEPPTSPSPAPSPPDPSPGGNMGDEDSPLASTAVLRATAFATVHSQVATAVAHARPEPGGYSLRISGWPTAFRPLPTVLFLFSFAAIPHFLYVNAGESKSIELRYFSITLSREDAIDRFVGRQVERLYDSVGDPPESLAIVDELYACVKDAEDALAGALESGVDDRHALDVVSSLYQTVEAYLPADIMSMPSAGESISDDMLEELRSRITVADVRLFAFVDFVRSSPLVSSIFGIRLSLPPSLAHLHAVMDPLFVTKPRL